MDRGKEDVTKEEEKTGSRGKKEQAETKYKKIIKT